MRDFNEQSITNETLARVASAPNPRVRQISEALIRHLHAFIREVRLSEAEWAAGIDFLTHVGKMCDATRQEFILLSDTLGVSTLVDAINHPLPKGATETTILGPFFLENRKSVSLGANIATGSDGVPMYISGTVSDVNGRRISFADIDIWHSDDEGFYDVQRNQEPSMRGHVKADEEGKFWLWSIRPKSYPIPNDGPVGKMLEMQGRHPYRPEHVHFMIGAPGYESLITHVFSDDDPYLDSDVVFGVKNSLVTPITHCSRGLAPDGSIVERDFFHLHYDFALRLKGSA